VKSSERRALRQLMRDALPWVSNPQVGPTTVDAGPCGACGVKPALVAVCGPVAFQSVCATCCVDSNEELFCAGHAEDAAYAKTYCTSLPSNWVQCVLLWWVATGEIQVADVLDVDTLVNQPGTQRASVDELVRRNAKLLGTGNVFFPIVNE